MARPAAAGSEASWASSAASLAFLEVGGSRVPEALPPGAGAALRQLAGAQHGVRRALAVRQRSLWAVGRDQVKRELEARGGRRGLLLPLLPLPLLPLPIWACRPAWRAWAAHRQCRCGQGAPLRSSTPALFARAP
jgi:hypothetical protein